MKRWIFGTSGFAIALAIGMWAGWSISPTNENAQPLVPAIETSRTGNEPPSETSPAPEFTNVKLPGEFENGDFYFLVPVYKGEAGFGKCELTSDFKKPWLALFKRGSRYTLEPVNVRLGTPEKDDFGTYVPIQFRNSRDTSFLFEHNGEVRSGPVTTLYEMPDGGDHGALLGYGFKKEFVIGDSRYVLRIGYGTTDTGSSIEIVVLESAGKQDLLYFRPQSFGSGNFGRFEWVGDMDGDNRLDIIFTFFAQNGGGKRYILFLSSAAKGNHLVQPYAFFNTRRMGC